MKRKYKRTFKKRLNSTTATINAIFAIFGFIFINIIHPIALEIIKKKYPFYSDTKIKVILAFLLIGLSILLFFIVNIIIYSFTKPDKKYFKLIDFEKPTDEVITKALERILNSEKSQSYFVHVAPINDEIESFFKNLKEKGFIWINGRPGEGKTMLAYHALYRYRKINIFANKFFKIRLFKYKIYKLEINRINEEKHILEVSKIEQILDELDSLKGRKRKIILIDDAHKLNFENSLRLEFEHEAEEKINGKFVWINTNYLETRKPNFSNSITIDFDKFYKKLLKELYQSENPLIKEIINKKCTNLKEAIKQKEKGRIKDPWHFNFVATKGEERITEVLENLGANEEEHKILAVSIFLFSVRNIITGEKEITKTDFINEILSTINNTFFYNLNQSNLSKIIADLAAQDYGRLLIFVDKSHFQTGFLQAPHYRLSIAIIKSISDNFHENEVKQMINASKIFFKNDYKNIKYLGIYFNSIVNYQKYFLDENKDLIKGFLTNLNVEHLHVYPSLLDVLKKCHKEFFKELTTDEYFNTIASKISLSSSNKFSEIQKFISVLESDKNKLIDKLNFKKLAQTANEAEVIQIQQVADFIQALGNRRNKLIDKLDFEKLAQTANKAEVVHFHQLAAFINSLIEDKYKINFINYLIKINSFGEFTLKINSADINQFKQIACFINALGNHRNKIIDKLDFEKLAQTANEAEVVHFEHVAAFINSLIEEKYKINFINCLIHLIQINKFKDLIFKINSADINQFKRIASFINALGKDRNKLIDKLDFEKLAQTANEAEVVHFNQLAAFIIDLGNDRNKLIDKLDFEKLALRANEAEVIHFNQLAAFINALGNDRNKLIDKLDFEKLALRANEAEVIHFEQLAAFINALGNDKNKLSQYLSVDTILSYSTLLDKDSIASFCIIIASLEVHKQNQVIQNIDWGSLLKFVVINHKIIINNITYILNYHNKKCNLLNEDVKNENIREYLDINRDKIVYFSTRYFTPPDDYQTTAFFLDALHPHAIEIAKKIVVKLKYEILKNFIISPRHYQSFSNLLYAFHNINPFESNEILLDHLVWRSLCSSFQEDDLKDQQNGLQNLLKSINTINPIKYNEIIANKILEQKLLTHFGILENILKKNE